MKRWWKTGLLVLLVLSNVFVNAHEHLASILAAGLVVQLLQHGELFGHHHGRSAEAARHQHGANHQPVANHQPSYAEAGRQESAPYQSSRYSAYDGYRGWSPYGQQAIKLYGQYANGQYGQSVNSQYGESGNGQYGPSANGQYGEFSGGQYGQSANGKYGESANGQYTGQTPSNFWPSAGNYMMPINTLDERILGRYNAYWRKKKR